MTKLSIEDRIALQDLIGRDLSGWLNPPPEGVPSRRDSGGPASIA